LLRFEVRVRGSPLRAIRNGSLVGLTRTASYRQTIETTNELAQIKF
jgi:hypothetical protein